MDAPSPATAPRMARRSIGETAADTVMMQVRWPGALLRRLDAIRGKRSRADVIRGAVEREVEAVERELERRENGAGTNERSPDITRTAAE